MDVAANRSLGNHSAWVLWAFLLAIASAEAWVSFLGVQFGLVLHAALLVLLLVAAGTAGTPVQRGMLLAVTLAPLTRIVSLSLPLYILPRLAWYPAVSIPLLAAFIAVVRQLCLSRADLGLVAGNVPIQLMVAVLGLPLGAAEYFILRPDSLVGELSPSRIWLATLILLLFTGLTEELIFRGLLQSLALRTLRHGALVYVSLLFAALHIGYQSVTDVIFVFGVGLLFAYIVLWGRSILGVTLAHGLTNAVLFVLMPNLASADSELQVAMPWLTVAAGALAFVGTGLLALRYYRSGGKQTTVQSETSSNTNQGPRAIPVAAETPADPTGSGKRRKSKRKRGRKRKTKHKIGKRRRVVVAGMLVFVAAGLLAVRYYRLVRDQSIPK